MSLNGEFKGHLMPFVSFSISSFPFSPSPFHKRLRQQKYDELHSRRLKSCNSAHLLAWHGIAWYILVGHGAKFGKANPNPSGNCGRSTWKGAPRSLCSLSIHLVSPLLPLLSLDEQPGFEVGGPGLLSSGRLQIRCDQSKQRPASSSQTPRNQ